MLDNAEAADLMRETSNSVVSIKDLNIRSCKKICHVTVARGAMCNFDRVKY